MRSPSPSFACQTTAWFALAAAGACAPPAAGPRPHPAAHAAAPHEVTRHYTIWLGGARVGTAIETEAWSAAGVTVERRERLSFLRGETPVALTTTIEIVADRALTPSSVRWTERGAGLRSDPIRSTQATRDPRGWTIVPACDDRDCTRPVLHAPPTLPADAVPAELIPLIVRRDGAFAGHVFLPARGFVVGAGRVEPLAPGRLVARLELDARVSVEATIDLGDDGIAARVVDGDGVIATRATPAEAEAAFVPVDLIEVTSVPVLGHRTDQIALLGDVAPPDLPGQARTGGHGDERVLALAADLPGHLPPGPPGVDRGAQIRALVAHVQHRIAPDLGAAAGSPRDAERATAGDCTTFALAYAALAQRIAIPTRVVTGLRVDGARLVRHRWAVSWTGRAWIAVDAAFGAAPAGGDLIGLAVHGADDAGLISGEAALTRVRAASWQ